MMPAARRIALRSQRNPNRSRRVPTTSCTAASGMRASAGPSATTRIASVAKPRPAPASAGRQPRTVPTARTTVSASTNSTSDARKAASSDGPSCAQLITVIVPPSGPVALFVSQHLDLLERDKAAAHHAVGDGQEGVDLLLAIDDLDDDGQVLR